jgi:hypothetical protein
MESKWRVNVSAEQDRASSKESDLPVRGLLWRVSWIGIRLILVYVLADEFQPFFYQAF